MCVSSDLGLKLFFENAVGGQLKVKSEKWRVKSGEWCVFGALLTWVEEM